jgi:hypothetical protein
VASTMAVADPPLMIAPTRPARERSAKNAMITRLELRRVRYFIRIPDTRSGTSPERETSGSDEKR